MILQNIQFPRLKELCRFLKYFLPISSKSFHVKTQEIVENHNRDFDEIKSILKELRESTADIQKTTTEVQKATNEINSNLNELKESTADIQKTTTKVQKATNKIKFNLNELKESIADVQKTTIDVQKVTNEIKESSSKVHNITNEILWADIFNSTIQESDWLKFKTFSPGRWAAGYAFLYIIYQVLHNAKPKRILEIGLGETSRVISQYSLQNPVVEHFIVEHDPEWISFFLHTFSIPDNTKIVQLPWAYQPYKKSESVRIYEGFTKFFANGKYDLICIDGPSGVGMKEYARIDSLSLLPENLADSFTILVDDYNRITERNMVNDMLLKLGEAKIPHYKGVYKGTKHTVVICSEDKKFLTSL